MFNVISVFGPLKFSGIKHIGLSIYSMAEYPASVYQLYNSITNVRVPQTGCMVRYLYPCSAADMSAAAYVGNVYAVNTRFSLYISILRLHLNIGL